MGFAQSTLRGFLVLLLEKNTFYADHTLTFMIQGVSNRFTVPKSVHHNFGGLSKSFLKVVTRVSPFDLVQA